MNTPGGESGYALTHDRCVFNDGMRWCYREFGNSRVLVKREDMLRPENVVAGVPVNLAVFLRRDDHNPPVARLTPEDVIGILQKGGHMVLPGTGPTEKW